MDKTLDRAWFLMGSNRFERSEQEIRKHLSENPEDPRAHTMLAICLFDLSRHDESIESGKKAIELVPENPYSYWVLGCLYMRLQQLDLAEKYLFEAIELDPEYPDFHASLSELYWMRGRSRELPYEKKKEFLDKGSKSARIGLEIEPEHFNSRLYLIKNLLAFGIDNYIAEAIYLAEQLLSLSPESADAHEVYAQALICQCKKTRNNKQNLDRILAILQEALRLDPNRPYAKFLACNLLEIYYSIIWAKLPFADSLAKIMTIAPIPLLLLTFYFYNTCGLQFYPTGVLTIATFVSLTLMINLTQAQIRIWLNPQYRIFLQSNVAINFFRWTYIVILFFGFSWKFLPVFVIRFLILVFWFCLPLTAIVLFFMIRRYLLVAFEKWSDRFKYIIQK